MNDEAESPSAGNVSVQTGRLAVYEPYYATPGQIRDALKRCGLPGAVGCTPKSVCVITRSPRSAQVLGKAYTALLQRPDADDAPALALVAMLREHRISTLLVRSFDRHSVDWSDLARQAPEIAIHFPVRDGGTRRVDGSSSADVAGDGILNQARLAIMTFVGAANYGALLQAYALQAAMRTYGLQADLIDYSCPHIAWAYSPVKRTGLMVGPAKEKLVRLWRCMLDRRRNRNFARFKRQNLKTTRCFYTLSDLAPLNEDYAGFIAGSDQVFNIRCSNLDAAFFLSFVTDDRKKFSYAASFGFDAIPPHFKPLFRGLLQGFSHFSMRESSGRDIIRDLLGREAMVHVDPTLLLTQADWDLVGAQSRGRLPRRYIFVYNVNAPHKLFPRAIELAAKTGCDIVYFGFDFYWIRKALRRGVHVSYAGGPETFVAAVAGATYVLTNSFHGAVFSVIYKKPFLVELENQGVFNHRAGNLLKMLGLESRVLDDRGVDVIDSPVDWARCETILQAEREKAVAYLESLV